MQRMLAMSEPLDLRAVEAAWNTMVGGTRVRGGDTLTKAELIDDVLNYVPALLATARDLRVTLESTMGYLPLGDIRDHVIAVLAATSASHDRSQ